MATYEVEVIGTSREVYVVEADSPEEAMATWHESGDRPIVAEVEDAEAVGVVVR